MGIGWLVETYYLLSTVSVAIEQPPVIFEEHGRRRKLMTIVYGHAVSFRATTDERGLGLKA